MRLHFRGYSLALGLLVCRLTLVGASSAGIPKDLWVAPDGRDDQQGSKSRPLATLEGARDRLRDLRRTSELPKGGVTVWLREGSYQRSATFELAAEDAGTIQSPITYRGVAGESVSVSGGRPIQLARPTEPSVLERLGPVARASVKVANLRAQGVENLGKMESRGFGRATRPAHLELFYEGKPMILARWPNEGQWATIGGIVEETARGDDHGGQIGRLEDGFILNTTRPFLWQPSTNLWIHGYWAWDWANSYERITEMDPDQRRIRTAPPHGLYGFRPGQRFYFVNVLEELDTPGEYYVDAESGLLYFWEPMASPSGRAVVSLLNTPLIRLRDTSYIVIRGLQLGNSRNHGISIEGGQRVKIVGCRLSNLGNHGVVIDGGHDHEVLSCDIVDTGDGGVVASGGDRQTLETGRHLVENSHFQRQGRWSKCYVPAIQFTGVGLLARHNHIHDHPHCAILFSGNDHRIEFNDIHHVALETGDVGAIYAGRDWTYRGNRIVHNYIHETGGVGMGSMGVYMDDCVSGTEIYGNVFREVQRAVFLGGGRDHRVENNVFINCHPAVAIDGRGLDQSPVWHNMVYRTMRDRLAEVPQQLYRERYPNLDALDAYYLDTKGVPPEGNSVRQNISTGGEWLTVGWHATDSMIDVSGNLVDQDPLFFDAARKDYRLKNESPALGLGFKPIPMDRVGTYPSDARRELARSLK